MGEVMPWCVEKIFNFTFYYRSKSAIEITNEFVDMYIEVPVAEWGKLLESADIPNLRLTMCGYISTVLTVLYEQEVVDELVDYLIGLFDLPDDIKVFCLQEFLPEMRLALNASHVDLTGEEFFKLEGNFISTIVKLLYAFLWQVSGTNNFFRLVYFSF